jgi:DNA-binding transcriptional ArsR family regulator
MPNQPEQQEDDKIVLSDPRAIRALAHPARLAILEALFPGDELTATECASLTGLSPSATSYHLKALARWGIVEAGQARADGRDRPWKAKGRSIEVSSQVPRGTVLAEVAVLETFLDRNRVLLAEFLDRQASEPPEWRDAAELASSDYWLTAEELAEVSRALRNVLQPYEHRRPGARPDKSRRVRVMRLIVPRRESSPLAGSGPDGSPSDDPVG